MKLRVFTAFSGYDSQCLALERLKQNFPDFDYELVGWSEIDKYAMSSTPTNCNTHSAWLGLKRRLRYE